MTNETKKEGKDKKTVIVAGELSTFRAEILEEIRELKKLILAMQTSKVTPKKPAVKKPIKNPIEDREANLEVLEAVKKIIHEKMNLHKNPQNDK